MIPRAALTYRDKRDQTRADVRVVVIRFMKILIFHYSFFHLLPLNINLFTFLTFQHDVVWLDRKIILNCVQQ